MKLYEELYVTGLLTLAGLIMMLSLLWIIWNLEAIQAQRKALLNTAQWIDMTIGTIESMEAGSTARRVHRGTATADDEQQLPRALLSGRECLAYRIQFGLPAGDDVVALDFDHSIQDAAPFFLDAKSRIRLSGDRYRFSATVQPSEYRPNQIRPEFRGRLGCLFTAACENRHTWRNGRFYEWILPHGSPCEILGAGPRQLGNYRSAEDLQLDDALINIGSHEVNFIVLERLRRQHSSVLRRAQRLRWKRSFVVLIGLLPILHGAWICWMIFNETPRSYGG